MGVYAVVHVDHDEQTSGNPVIPKHAKDYIEATDNNDYRVCLKDCIIGYIQLMDDIQDSGMIYWRVSNVDPPDRVESDWQGQFTDTLDAIQLLADMFSPDIALYFRRTYRK